MNRILAVLGGCMVAVLVIFLGDTLVHVLYPLPDNIDLKDPEQLKMLAKSVPPISLVLVLLSGFLGAFIGGLIATMIMKNNDRIAAIIVGAVLTVLGILN